MFMLMKLRCSLTSRTRRSYFGWRKNCPMETGLRDQTGMDHLKKVESCIYLRYSGIWESHMK